MPRLHVLTPPGLDMNALDAVLATGAPLVQVRVKGGADRELLRRARAAVARAHAHGARCVVNDRVDVAIAAGADGVHLGADDLPVADARALLDTWPAGGGRRLVGGTARDAATARRLARAGADYLGVGPCHATRSKPGLPAPGGPGRVAAVAAVVDIPVIAIGGVTPARVPALREAGAHGVAVIGAVWSAPDPARAVTDLLAAVRAPA